MATPPFPDGEAGAHVCLVDFVDVPTTGWGPSGCDSMQFQAVWETFHAACLPRHARSMWKLAPPDTGLLSFPTVKYSQDTCQYLMSLRAFSFPHAGLGCVQLSQCRKPKTLMYQTRISLPSIWVPCHTARALPSNTPHSSAAPPPPTSLPTPKL